MPRFLHRRPRGTTLIEVVIYAALLGVGLLTLTTIYLASINTGAVIATQNVLLENRRLTETTMLAALEQAGSVTLPLSGASGVLTVTSPVPEENPATFSVSDGALTMKLGAASAVPITSPEVAVTGFSVERLDGTPATLSITITYQARTGQNRVITQTSAFTYVLRH